MAIQPTLLSLLAALVFCAPASAISRLDEADDAYAYVAALSAKGMHDLVVKEAQEFLEHHARHAKADHARYRLGAALLELGRTADALAALTSVAKKRGFEFEAEANFRLGQCQLARGDGAAADAAFSRVLELAKDYLVLPAHALRGEARLRVKAYAGARADFEAVVAAAAAPEAKDHLSDADCGLAWCDYREGQAAAATQRIQRLLAAQSVARARVDEMRFLLGESELDARHPDRALEAYRGVRADEWKDAALRGAGFALAELGDHAGAAREFARVLTDHPKSRFSAECALHCGIEKLAANDAAGAVQALGHEALILDAQGLYWRARAQAGAGRADEALASLDRALATRPTDDWKSRVQSARGEVLEKLGRSEEALDAFERAGSTDALVAAAAGHLAAKKYDDADRVARGVLARKPTPAQATSAWLVVGEAHFARAQYDSAERAFRSAGEATEEPSTRVRAALRGAWCRYLDKDAAGARPLFEEIARSGAGPEAEEARYMVARCAEAAGDADGARAAFRAVLERDGRGAHAGEAALALARLSPDAEAVEILERLGRSAGNSVPVEALFDLAERYSSLGRHADARARYEAFLERAPDSKLAPRARYGLAWCAWSAGDVVRATHELDSLLGSGPKAAQRAQLDDSLRLSATELAVWCAAKVGDGVGAAARCREFARAGADEPRALKAVRVVLEVLVKAREFDAALALLSDLARSLRTPASRAGLAIERAWIELDRGRLDDAEREIARAKKQQGEVDVRLAEACFFVGEARFTAGADQRAIDLYAWTAACAASPLLDRALYKSGFARLRQADNAGAEKDLERLVTQAPASALLHESLFLRGEALFRLERLEEAATCFERVRKEAPDHAVMPKVLFRLGITMARLSRPKEAESTLATLVKRYPEFENLAEAELWRGRALAALDDARGARAAFERVIAKDRGVLAASARIGLGHLLAAANDHDGALSEFLKVAVLSSHSDSVAEALLGAGAELEALSQPDRARAQYEEILAQHKASRFVEEARNRLSRLVSK